MRAKLFMLVVVTGLLLPGISCAQVSAPEIGNPFPDLTFHDVANYKGKEFRIADHRGKWVIVDLWSLGCKSCWTTFPVLRDIQRVHHDKVQLLLVGRKDQDFNANIETIFKKISSNLNFIVPVTYHTSLQKDWDIPAYPHMFIIDPEGIVRFVTDGRDLSVEKITALLEGREVAFYPGMDSTTKEFDPWSLAEPGEIEFGVLITHANGERQFADADLNVIDPFSLEQHEKGWAAANIPLYAIYNYAFLGKWIWNRRDTMSYANIFSYPVLEMKDTTQFSFDYDEFPAAGTYNCFVKLQRDKWNKEYLMMELQEALKKAFGYNASIEWRNVPVWSLVAKPGAKKKLHTKGGLAYRSPGSAAGGFIIRNQSMNELIGLLTAHLPFNRRTMFVDGTGIRSNIDFSIDTDMTDFYIVQKELARKGLEFVRADRKMKVLVIRDP